MSVRTSLIIPAHNESARLAEGYRRLAPVLEELSLATTEVIVIDDGSSDDTLRVAHDVYGHLPHTLFVQQPSNLGKGAAVRLGIALARGEHLLAADADMAIRPEHFIAMVTALEHSALAPGSRALRGRIHYDSALRTLTGSAFHHLVRHYTGVTLRDTQCGAKGFQRGPARLLALLGMVNGFAYDAEMFFLAEQLGMAIEPVQVTWDDVRGSSVRVGHDSLQMIRDLRSLRRTHYVNPVIELARDVAVADIDRVAREARVQGLVVARGASDALLVLARDASLAALGIAASLGGRLRTAGIGELRGRTCDAV